MAADAAEDALPVRLVVGLGNPGPRYARTRHNAGEVVVTDLARRLGAGRAVRRYGGRLQEARGPAGPVTILVPGTYMNLSGDSVGPAAGALRLRPEQVLVVHDDIDLAFGTVRGKAGGGHGGHNGLRDLTRGLGSGDYPRVRLGVGRPPPGFRGDEADWVLMSFTEPQVEVEEMLTRGREMVECVLAEGIASAIARFHASPPGARARARRDRRAGAAAGGDEEAGP